jgi:hypothetical protein
VYSSVCFVLKQKPKFSHLMAPANITLFSVMCSGAVDAFVRLKYGAAYWVIGTQHFKAACFPDLQWLKCPVPLFIMSHEVKTPW